jgi:hypothetical protein
MPAIRDEEYAAVVQRERPLIQATAYLLLGDPVQAERVVQLVFAQLYHGWPRRGPRMMMMMMRDLIRTARAPVHLPWEYRNRRRSANAQLRPTGCRRPGVLRRTIQRPDC